MKKIIIVLILLTTCFFTTNLGYCDEGEISVCNIQSYSISSDNTFSRIYLPCSGDAQSLFLNILNPQSLLVEKTYQFNGLIDDVYSINAGQKLLVALGELDGNSSTEEGMLVEIDYTTGDILRSLNLN